MSVDKAGLEIAHAKRRPLTVTDLTRNLKRCLRDYFPDVWVQGEVVEFKRHQTSRHWYFRIKDKRSVLSCVMYRGRNQTLSWEPQNGDQIFLKGSIDIYPPRGTYNLDVREIHPLGEGIFRKRIEALKRKLNAAGLFDPARKRPLPFMPRAIGVATSGSGAAFHDIRKVIEQRFPNVTLYLAHCQVQGQGAAASIVKAIAALNRHGKSEVLIVGRGGGSKEDLMAFNEEAVARAIAASTIPIVSAVGHQIDESISDLVADAFAATPSHAAELVVPERAALQARIDALRAQLGRGAQRAVQLRRDHLQRLEQRSAHSARREIARSRQRLERIQGRSARGMKRELVRWRQHVQRISLRHPVEQIRDARRRYQALHKDLLRAMQRDLKGRQVRLNGFKLRHPTEQIEEARQRCLMLQKELLRGMMWELGARRQQVQILAGRLNALSPLAVLSRGYSLTLRGDQAVRDVAELEVGDRVELRFARGRAFARIEES